MPGAASMTPDVPSPFDPDAGYSDAYQPLGLAVLLRDATAGNDLTLLGQSLIEYAQGHDDPYALLELSLVLQLKYQRESALAVQTHALGKRRHYWLKTARSAQPALKMLAPKASGKLMANTPIECLLEKADLKIEVVSVDERALNDNRLPEHDVIL